MSWREEILKEFAPGVSRLTLVADPDGLLAEERVAAELGERSFDVLRFEDPVAFRYAYESGYRCRWERGESPNLVVTLPGESADLKGLPYDVFQAGRKLAFTLSELFPSLSYPVVSELGGAELDLLYQAQAEHDPGRLLGDNQTKDFVLRYVFGIVPELTRRPADLLRILLQRHYGGRPMPGLLNERLIRHLRGIGGFKEWPLERIVPDREAFFAFLQERWPVFLDRLAKANGEQSEGPNASYHMEYHGPEDIPLDHEDVRAYVDTLFLEGFLKPVAHPAAHRLAEQWVAVGLKIDPQADDERRLSGLLNTAEDSVPDAEAEHRQWLGFARRWGELQALHSKVDSPELKTRFLTFRERVDSSFLSWVGSRYGGLHNLPSVSPAMLHHVPRALARDLESGNAERVALVVVDGLAFDQWVVLRNALGTQMPEVGFHEEATFAWIPAITPVSRQALFAGKPPVYFPASIGTSSKERSLWRQFWADSLGLTDAEVEYVNVQGNEDVGTVEETISHPSLRVAGIIVRMVDMIMHGMRLGTRGMHDQVRMWAEQQYLSRLLSSLLEQGFSVYLTSDHGNIEAKGCGRPSEGSVAEVRGERVRVYTDSLLRAETAKRFPGAVEWSASGLPEGYLPLLAPNRTAFIRAGERIVGHGGISIEELVVPFVQIRERT